MARVEKEVGGKGSKVSALAKTFVAGVFRSRLGKGTALALSCGAFSLCVWLVGTVVSWVTPPSYQSSALVRPAPGAAALEVAEGMRSEAVMKAAARALASWEGADPMSEYLLSTALSVGVEGESGVVRLEARSDDAGDARRMVMAVMDAYVSVHGGADVVHIDPEDKAPDGVSGEARMALGLGGLAGLGLLLAIPLLEGVERVLPLRRDEGLKV